MDSTHTRSQAIFLGHLAITLPIILFITLSLLAGLPINGPLIWPYYIAGGFTIAWQWYSAALPRYKEWLKRKGIPEEQLGAVARRNGLEWPGASSIGLFALHTTAAALCAIHFGPWLLSRWFAWIAPLTGMGHHAPAGNDWLQHFELASIVPALILGYIVSSYLPRMATSAWLLPAFILAYKLVTFTVPYTSILATRSPTRFSYFFDIQRSMPTFFGDGDPVRVAQQIFVVAPFYAGLAYSVGAVAARHKIFEQFFAHERRAQAGTELEEEVQRPA